jgi:hypothetical protein
MIRSRLPWTILLGATMLAGLAAPHPAAAQSDAQIQAIEREIRALQNELAHVKADLAARDRALRAAQTQAKAAQDQAAAAATAAQQVQQQVAAAPPAPPPPPPAPPLPSGTFRVGGVTVTLGGFAAGEGVWRQRNQAASIDTNFNGGIPLRNSPNYHIPEFRETAQQSRFSLLAQGQVDDVTKLSSYMETDFLSAGSSSNSNQSNSYTLRLRQFWADYDRRDLGLYVLGGQAWSLATMYRVGLVPRQENVPLTIDAQYVAGFNWERQAQLRIVKDFADNRVSAGLSLEEPQTTFGSAAGTNCLTGAAATTAAPGGVLEYTQCGGSNVNSVQAYSDNNAPDIIAKVAADPGYGHYELYGLLRFLGGRVSAAGSGRNYQTTGQGIGAGMILPLVPHMLDFQLSGLVGQGVGRYGSAQIADVTFATNGKIEPIPSYSVMGGFVGHPIPAIDLYAYGGAEQASRKFYTLGSINSGYGNPNVNLSGCDVELGSCSANTSGVVEGTVGAWWRFLKGSYGTMQAGLQYEWLGRNTFRGVGATKGSSLSPSSDENIFLFSFRYLPFQ